MSDIVIIGGGMCMHLMVFNPMDQANPECFSGDIFKTKGLSITVIMANEFTEFPFAGPILIKNPEKAHEFMCTDKSKFTRPNIAYIYGTVTKVDPVAKTVTVGTNRVVSYKALAVATGKYLPGINPVPGQTIGDRLAEIQTLHEKCKAAQTIALGGAGPIALELAGNLRVLNPSARIVLISRDGLPLEKYHDTPYRNKCTEALKSKKIEVLQGELEGESGSIQPILEPGQVKLSGGVFKYDVMIPCFYQKANTGFLKGTGAIDENTGLLITADLSFQCEKYPEIFGILNTTTEHPTKHMVVGGAMYKAATVTSNLIKFASNRPIDRGFQFKEMGGNGSFDKPFYYNIGVGEGALTIVHMESVLKALPPAACCQALGYPFCPPVCCWGMYPGCKKYCHQIDEWTLHHGKGFATFMLKDNWIPNTGWGYLSKQTPEQMKMGISDTSPLLK